MYFDDCLSLYLPFTVVFDGGVGGVEIVGVVAGVVEVVVIAVTVSTLLGVMWDIVNAMPNKYASVFIAPLAC